MGEAVEALEREKEKRVENVAGMAVKRLANQNILRGWTAWHALYAEHVRKRRMLAQAASRLARPGLTAAMSHWRSS